MIGVTYKIKTYSLDKKGRVRFIRYELADNGYSYNEDVYKTCLTQDLELRCNDLGHWTAYMAMKEMSPQKDPQLSFGKLHNWLGRMSKAIEHLQSNIETGLENPMLIDNPNRPNQLPQPDSFRYSRDGLIEQLKKQRCPLLPLE